MKEPGKPKTALIMSWKDKTGMSIPRDQINPPLTTWWSPITFRPWRPRIEWRVSSMSLEKMASPTSKPRWRLRDQPSPRRSTLTQSLSQEMIWSRNLLKCVRKRLMNLTKKLLLPINTSKLTPWRRKRLRNSTSTKISERVMWIKLVLDTINAEFPPWLSARSW